MVIQLVEHCSDNRLRAKMKRNGIESYHHPSHRLSCMSDKCYRSYTYMRTKLHPTDEVCDITGRMPTQARMWQGSNVASEELVLEAKSLLSSRPQLHRVEKWLTQIHMHLRKEGLCLACIGGLKMECLWYFFFSVTMNHTFSPLLLEPFLPIMREKTLMP